jgi:hypothetical protein
MEQELPTLSEHLIEMPVKNQLQGMLMDLSVKIKSGSETFWTVKQMANITSNMLSFIFLTEQLIIYGKKQK